MYSIYNEEKSVVAERFIRTLKNKVYKHMILLINTITHLIELLKSSL